jgi:hypothetical protein
MAEGEEANLNLGVRKPSRLMSGVEEFLAVEDVSAGYPDRVAPPQDTER